MTLASLSPDAALILFTLGILLIYFELNRPGLILSGAIGLLIVLLASSVLLKHPLNPALLLIAAAVAILVYDLLRPTHFLAALVATLCLIFGFLHLIPNPANPHVHAPAAIICGLILGTGTSILTRIARRARANKGLDLVRARTSRPGAFKS